MKRKALGLFATFFKIGAFTFGGGYAMIPLIQREIVDKKQWATNEDLLDIIAIAESTPGPIAVNAATFIGSKIDGFFGALFATLGVVLPSFITILAVSFAIAQFEHIKIVQYAFTGIRAAVLALIIRALATMYKECPKSPLSYIIAAAAFFVAAFTSINTIFIILGCAAVGLAVHLVFNTKTERRGKANDFHRIILHIFQDWLVYCRRRICNAPAYQNGSSQQGLADGGGNCEFHCRERKHTGAVRSQYCNLYRFCPRRGSRGSLCNARSCASVVSDYSCDCAML